MHDANIITLYKNKGDCSDCNNYLGISLLSIAGRPLPSQYWTGSRCLLSMFTQKCSVDSELEDSHSTWSLHYISSKRSDTSRSDLCTSHLLTWPRLLTWSAEKASLLQRTGCPPKLLRIINFFHENMQCTVQYDGSSSDSFPISNGVKQGCIPAPTLFGIFFSFLLS